jgi:hypothetical protein
MKRVFTILMIAAVLGTLVAGAALVMWRIRLHDQSFYTDADSIEVPVEGADVRDVLWRPAEMLPAPANSGLDDLEPRIAADGMSMYLVRATEDGDTDIFIATREHEGWLEPAAFAPLNSRYDDQGPTPGADGRSIYFYSNRPGGYGGFDIWRIDRTATGWSDAVNLGEPVNSRFNDYAPAVSSDGASLYFASDRPAGESEEAQFAAGAADLPEELRSRLDYDLYLARSDEAGRFPTAEAVADLNTDADEITPALSPSGDFLYFASNRDGTFGGFDLYRSRRVRDEHREPEHFGAEINSSANEISPALDMAGFALQFNSDRLPEGAEAGVPADGAAEADGEAIAAADHNIYRALSREVFTARADTRIDWRELWNALWPSLLWLLLGLVGLLALLRYFQQAQFKRLSLIARCLLVSLLVHLVVMMLMTAWSVTTTITDIVVQSEGTHVAITASGSGPSIETQLRGAITAMNVSAPGAPAGGQHQTAPNFDRPSLGAATLEIAEQSRDYAEAGSVVRSAELSESQAPENIAAINPAAGREALIPAAAASGNIALPEVSEGAQASEAMVAIDGAAGGMAAHAGRAEQSDPGSAAGAPTAIQAQLVPRDSQGGSASGAPEISLAGSAEALREMPAQGRVGGASPLSSGDRAIASLPPAQVGDVVGALPGASPGTSGAEVEVRIPATGGAAMSAGGRASGDPDATESARGAGAPVLARSDLEPAGGGAIEGGDSPILAVAATPGEAPSRETGGGSAIGHSDGVVPSAIPGGDALVQLPTETMGAADAGEAGLAIGRGAGSDVASPAGTRASTGALGEGVVEGDPAPATVVLAPLASGGSNDGVGAAGSMAVVGENANETSGGDAPSRIASGPAGLPPMLSTPEVAIPGGGGVQGAFAQNGVEGEPTGELSGAVQSAPSHRGAAPHAMDNGSAIGAPAIPSTVGEEGFMAHTQRAGAGDDDTSLSATAPSARESASHDLGLVVPAEVGLGGSGFPAALVAEAGPLRLPSDMPAPADHALAQRTWEQRTEIIDEMGGSAATEEAVNLALQWLADHQSDDGHWDGNDFDVSGECGGETTAEVDLALTGLALMAFLAGDNTHDKPGPYRDNVRRGLDWLLAQQQRDGSLMGEETLYSHGISTIAICEALAMTDDPRLLEPARRATQFILESPSPESGGWRYAPGQFGDTSVTGWQVLALASARRAKLELPADALGHVRDWMERVRDPAQPGRYGYQPGQQFSPAMTAEGMFIRQMLGVSRDDPDMHASVEFMLNNLPEWTREREQNSYYWYYATLAMFHYQGDAWTEWNEQLKEVLLENQRQDGCAAGSWDPIDQWSKIGGRIYQTAICALCLEIYYRFQPIYESNEVVSPIGTIRGEVRDKVTMEFLPGATIRLDLPDREPLIATTDYSGRYSLAAPEMPEFFAISASLPGYSPQSAGASAEELAGKVLVRNFLLDPMSEHLISIEENPEVHHVGNDRFEGAINSQFQRQSEGVEWTSTFTLTQAQVEGFAEAELVLLCKGVQADNIITINGRRLSQRLNASPTDGSYGEFATPIDTRLLRAGENEVSIRSSDSLGDLDDFEFVNVRVRLISGRDG